MKVSVLIGTYGDPSWAKLARRARASTAGQGAHEVLYGHEEHGTLASVRNSLAASASGDWLCFLDGDDELASGYLEAMREAWMAAQTDPDRGWVTNAETGERLTWRNPDRACQHCGFGISAPCHTARSICPNCDRPGRAKLLAPAVQYVTTSGARHPARIPTKHHCGGDIRRGSWLVIGTLVPRHVFHTVGGFRDYPLYEDWALFAACWKAGCLIVEVPSAVYVAHMRQGSRNRGHDRQTRLDAHWRITADLFPDLLPAARA